MEHGLLPGCRTGMALRQRKGIEALKQRRALHHNAELVSFNADFDAIASVRALRLTRLIRPG